MRKVVVTGLGAVLTSATDDIIGGWSSASRGAGLFTAIPPQKQDLLELMRRESQGLFDRFSPGQTARRSVVWSVSKNNFSLFEDWIGGGDRDFFSDFEAHFLARTFGLGGQAMCPVAACASGSHALILGARLIEAGDADVVLCGASEPPQHPVILAAYRNMGASSPSGAMRPFDRRRDGFVPASGSGFLVLESLDHAQNRGAQVHALLSGYSMRSDASHMTSMSSSGDSIVRAIDEALSKANGSMIGYINAHGTATRLNDALEARALNRVFGSKTLVSSTKPLTGHLLGASGAVEAVISIVAMKEGVLPPTMGLEEPEIDLDFVREERGGEVGSVLSLNYGFGGHIGAVVFDKLPTDEHR